MIAEVAATMRGTVAARAAARGFTIVELMIAVAVLAILLAIAVPSYEAAARSSQLRSIANDLVASAYLARSEAIKRNTVVTLCASTDGEACGDEAAWHEGWIVGCLSNDGDTCIAGGADWMVIQRREHVPQRMRVSAGNNLVNFQPTGIGATRTVFTICRAGDSAGSQQRVVTIDLSGRASARQADVGESGCS